MVDPHSEREIANAILEVLSDDELRNKLSAMGLERAEKFRWNVIAEKTMQVYREAHRDQKPFPR